MNRLSADELTSRLGSWDAPGDLRRHRLADAISALVEQGHVPGGAVLPSERKLASKLDIARGTVGAAYAELRDRGVVETWHGHGTVVRRDVTPTPAGTTLTRQSDLSISHVFDPSAPHDDSVVDLRASILSNPPTPAPDLLDKTRAGLAERWTSPTVEPQGLVGLREAIADRLTGEGLPTAPDQVIVTSGAQQALVLIAQLILRPNDLVVTEDVTYAGVLDAFRSVGVVPEGIECSAPGINLSALRRVLSRHTPAVLYLNPTVQNPTGTTMPGPARALLTEAVAPTDMYVVDDRSQADLQWAGQTPMPLAAYAGDDARRRHITVGSLSKVAWDGLRIGWIRCDQALVAPLLRLRLTADVMTSTPSQLIAEQLLRTPVLVAETVQQLERAESDAAQLLNDALPDWTWQPPTGGMNFWVDTKFGDPAALFDAAHRHGVLLVRGSAHRPDGVETGHFRFPFAAPPRTLEEGVRRLARAWADLTDQPINASTEFTEP